MLAAGPTARRGRKCSTRRGTVWIITGDVDRVLVVVGVGLFDLSGISLCVVVAAVGSCRPGRVVVTGGPGRGERVWGRTSRSSDP